MTIHSMYDLTINGEYQGEVMYLVLRDKYDLSLKGVEPPPALYPYTFKDKRGNTVTIKLSEHIEEYRVKNNVFIFNGSFRYRRTVNGQKYDYRSLATRKQADLVSDLISYHVGDFSQKDWESLHSNLSLSAIVEKIRKGEIA